MAPTGGAEPILGNNPWSVAVPGGAEGGVVLDMANSVVARGKIILAGKNEAKIPLGWSLDANGLPTDDPKAALAGSLLPIGGYKGYGISLIVDLLAGVLSGAAYGPHVGSPRNPAAKQDVGQMFMAIEVETIQPLEAFKESVGRYIREVKGSKLAKDSREIFVPGEIESRSETEQRKNGIRISESVMRSIKKVADETGVLIPEEIWISK
jgi:LDH2 family malate/lactate/ureidoglycolate dehydrogenase